MGKFLSSDKLFFGGVVLVSIFVIAVGIFAFSSSDESSTVADQKDLLIKQDSYVKGAKEAKVKIVEFSDFQCPACGAAYPIVKKVVAEYKDEVSFAYRHFPIMNAHQYALEAAQACEAAGEQGKFWEYHDTLFENQDNLSRNDLLSYAKNLNLDMNKFENALNSRKYKSKVIADLEDAGELGVNSTPTFFINGKKYVGVIDYERFKSIIDKELGSLN